MQNDLLKDALRQARELTSPLQTAALLRIARAASGEDPSSARQLLLEALDNCRQLRGSQHRRLMDEAGTVAAAVAPDLLPQIPLSQPGFSSGTILQTMLDYGNIEAAANYLLQYSEAGSFPFLFVGSLLHKLDPNHADRTGLRIAVLRKAFVMWRTDSSPSLGHDRSHFLLVFGNFWKELPHDEALFIAHAIVTKSRTEPDAGISANYMGEVHFNSPRQHSLFQIIHVLRSIAPSLADSLIQSHDQLAAAVNRYPNGLETMREETAAATERLKQEGATCQSGGSFILAGASSDFARQRRLIDAIRSGDFEAAIEDAHERYQEDTSEAAPNYAPKPMWPSTGDYRILAYHMAKRNGIDALPMLERIPDTDLRLFARIEMAAALAGAPAPQVTHSRQSHPPESSGASRRTSNASRPFGPTILSPEDKKIRCPKCLFEPPSESRWTCTCGHRWNTFWTAGRCPACSLQWKETQCPQCAEQSDHQAWYQN